MFKKVTSTDNGVARRVECVNIDVVLTDKIIERSDFVKDFFEEEDTGFEEIIKRDDCHHGNSLILIRTINEERSVRFLTSLHNNMKDVPFFNRYIFFCF